MARRFEIGAAAKARRIVLVRVAVRDGGGYAHPRRAERVDANYPPWKVRSVGLPSWIVPTMS